MRGKIVTIFTVLLLGPAWSSSQANGDSNEPLTLFLPAIIKAAQQKPQISDIYKLPDTGQVKCYNMGQLAGQIACPSERGRFYGQDANYHGPQPTYKANGDSTVTDLNTNLTWQQNTAASSTWHEAVNYCSALSLAGFDNWLLPSKHELQTIVNYSQKNPASNSVFSSQSSGYWSVTPVANTTNLTWAVYFDYGNDLRQEKTKKFYVRCVRK